jgi:hypothetical protein
MVSQSRQSTESHLPAVAESVVLFHLQDYAVAGFFEYDPFVRFKGAQRTPRPLYTQLPTKGITVRDLALGSKVKDGLVRKSLI